MEKKTKKRYSNAFREDDARHYVIYSELCKMKIDSPFLRAEIILQALKDANI